MQVKQQQWVRVRFLLRPSRKSPSCSAKRRGCSLPHQACMLIHSESRGKTQAQCCRYLDARFVLDQSIAIVACGGLVVVLGIVCVLWNVLYETRTAVQDQHRYTPHTARRSQGRSGTARSSVLVDENGCVSTSCVLWRRAVHRPIKRSAFRGKEACGVVCVALCDAVWLGLR